MCAGEIGTLLILAAKMRTRTYHRYCEIQINLNNFTDPSAVTCLMSKDPGDLRIADGHLYVHMYMYNIIYANSHIFR